MERQARTETRCLIVVHSYHHNNTLKIANVISKVLNADLKTVENVNIEELDKYDLIGFGAGIDSGHHYQELLDLAKEIPTVHDNKSFIFSTCAVMGDKKIWKDHTALRNILLSKGYSIIDEFSCKGFNTNSFLKFFGGMNKGRPNEEDLNEAKEFAIRLIQSS